MASLASSRFSASTGAPRANASAFASTVLRTVAQAWKAWQNRRAFYKLGEMSDTELADIGLTRTDLSVAVGLPFVEDPTARLGAIAHSRIRCVEDGARRVC